MKKGLVLSASVLLLAGTTVAPHAADGKHEYSAGHVASVNQMNGDFILDNGMSFVAEAPSEVRSLWVGESVLVRYVATPRTNIADRISVAPRGLVDPITDSE